MAEIYLFKSNQCINSFNLALGNVQHEIGNLNRTVENVVHLIDESFNDIKRVVDKRKQDLLKQLTKIKETKTNLLNDQIKLIMNEKQKVELECKQYHQSNIESKLLGAQIQNINEKLDCLRTLCEPRENSFINYEYKFNNCVDAMASTMESFGRFKVSNTYPPLCMAKIIDDNQVLCPSQSSANANSNNESTYVCSANLSITVQIETVDYYGNKRVEGGDPITILVTDPYTRQQYFKVLNVFISLIFTIFIYFVLTHILGSEGTMWLDLCDLLFGGEKSQLVFLLFLNRKSSKDDHNQIL
jgi:hypothetical protein